MTSAASLRRPALGCRKVWALSGTRPRVEDGYPDGIGPARRGYEAFESLAADARDLIAECPCESGCPSCVQSPKCGNLNEPLSKAGAVALLDVMLGRNSVLPQPGPPPIGGAQAGSGVADHPAM